ncbi:ankyrin repeat-containing domain protein [Hygrophoropsis aurantiaca]|uniref:Ankyrin repeat-containing domain protein n=1 Tax=Hygrophoropsis aurantiaca TaxID=72124 RepID=A0ACB7ZY92_9AGAM|nr:ankyrin repeat-containing domain protein [Hygrophoropsis aurantiaca]
MESQDGSLLHGHLSNIAITGDLAGGLGTRKHDIKVFVDGKEIWNPDGWKNASQLAREESHMFTFRASSTVHVSIIRNSFRKKLRSVLAQRECRLEWEYKGTMADLFTQDAKLSLQGSDGSPSSSFITIKISLDSNTAKRIMEEVDVNLARLDRNTTVNRASDVIGASVSIVPAAYDAAQTLGTVVTPLGQVLSVLVKIVDNVSDAHPILKVSWTVLSATYKAVQQQNLQDADVRDLAESLREMICAAHDCPDLREIEGAANVTEEIGSTALKIAVLIEECTKHSSIIVRTSVSTFKDLASRINECKQDCIQLKEKFDRRVQMETRHDVKEIGQQVREQLVPAAAIIIRNQEEEKILQWLAAPDPSVGYNAALEKRCEGTGSWFLTGEKFKQWKTTADVPLWISGIPGCGKTVLCSSIVEDVVGIQSGTSSACAYFFFDGRDSQDEFQLHHKLIRSLIKQFTSCLPSIPSFLKRLYGTGDHQPLLRDLEKMLDEIVDQFDDTFIVIDSLDECSKKRALLGWITNISQQKTGKLHLLVTSRPEQDIVEKMDQLTFIHVLMEAGDITEDIKSYVNTEITTNDRLSSIPMDNLRTKLVEDACGMFRLVAFRLEELQHCRTYHELQEALRNLPKDLYTMYYRMVSKLRSTDQPRVLRILQWLAFSRRHLSLEEVAEVVAVDMSGKKAHFDANHRFFNIQDVLLVCGGFISYSHGMVKLSHMSIKDYLLSGQHQEPSGIQTNTSLAHSVIAQTCLAYLLQFTQPRSTNDIMHLFPLAEYAAYYWFDHARSVDGDSNVRSQHQLTMELFDKDHSAFMVWVKLYDPDRTYGMQCTPSPLYYAAHIGLQWVLQELLDQGADLNVQGGTYGSPLQAASVFGYMQVVELLLSKGADPNIQSGFYGSALQAASHRGHMQVVELLLNKGADPNIQGGKYGSALLAASSGGHMQVIELLLSKGVDLNIQGGFFGSALRVASYEGHVQVVELLLSKGADLNLQGGEFGSALLAASSRGYMQVIELLLSKGADPNIQSGEYGNTLQAVSFWGHVQVVELLLSKGADPNIRNGFYGSALQAASHRGHMQVVELLLSKGADPNIRGGKYGSALQAASYEGHMQIVVELLLSKGADPNLQSVIYGSTLQAASFWGHVQVVELLLSKGADPNIQGGKHGSALQAASSEGHTQVVKLLLSKGANPNIQGGIFGSALQLAVDNNHKEIVELLHSKGANQEVIL